MRTLIIGDVHGCLLELEDLVELFSPVATQDHLIQVGDLINKGPNSVGCLQFAQKMGMQCIQGNHEAKFLRVAGLAQELRSEKESAYLKKLGAQILDYKDWIQSWPMWVQTPEFTVVHAGLEPGKKHLSEMSARALLTIRTWDGEGLNLDNPLDPPWYQCVQWPTPVIFGHWALQGLVDLPMYKGLDTGCVYGGRLTGFCPQENRFYSVPARKEYVPLVPGVIVN